MNGIDKIVDRILKAADLEKEKILAAAEADAKDIYGSLKDLADADAREIIGRGTEQAQKRIERSQGTAELESRRMLLESKQKMVDQVFLRAKGLLMQLPDEQYTDFLARLADRAVTSGTEEIVLGGADFDRYEQVLLRKINALSAARGLQSGIRIVRESADFDGGLIVRQGNVEADCTFDSMLRMMRDSIVGEIADILFA